MSHPLASLLTVLALAPVAVAQSTKLSGRQDHDPGAAGGDVRRARFTPDGSGLLYLADGEEPGIVDLYAAPGGGGPAVRLSATDPLYPDASVTAFEVGPAGIVAYAANVSGRLWSVPASGAAAPLLLAESAGPFALAPDGLSVVFGGRTGAQHELRTSALDGSGSLLLDATQVGSVYLSPDGSRAVYHTAGDELRSVRLDGSEPPRILAALPSIAYDVRLSAGGRAVFRALAPGGIFGIYSVPLDGSAAPLQLDDGSESVWAFELGGEIAVTFQGYSVLHAFHLDGSSSVALTALSLPPGFQITPDGARVVFVGAGSELFSVPIGGGAVEPLSGPLVAGGEVQAFQVTPDSVGVVFRADREVDEIVELYGVPFGGVPFRLSAPMLANRNVTDFAISPDDLHVIYRADHPVNDRFELHRVAITGGPSRILNGALVTGGDVTPSGYVIDPHSARVAYLADQAIDEQVELFVASIVGVGEPVKANRELIGGPASGEVEEYELTPDGASVVYAAARARGETLGLYRVPIEGGVPARLSARAVAGGQIASWELTPDGRDLVYLADQDEARVPELFAVPLDGSAVPRKLNHELPPSFFRGVQVYAVTPDSERVVYRAREGSQAYLYVARVDGSSAPLRIVPTDIDGGSPGSFLPLQITPDGATVVFSSGQHLNAVPTDGGGAMIRLTPDRPSAAGGGLTRFALTPDGDRVVYLADARIATQFELFSTPTDGPAASARRLSGVLPTNGDVTEFEIGARGERVVYRDWLHIYSVPVRGARHVRKLGSEKLLDRARLTPPVGATTPTFTLSPLGTSVLFTWGETLSIDAYLAPIDGPAPAQPFLTGSRIHVFTPDGASILSDRWRNQVVVVPADGSAPPLQLNSPPPDSRVSNLAASDRWAVYTANERTARFELFGRPLDASLPHLVLSGPFVSGGEIPRDDPHAFRIAPGERYVVYRADQDAPNRIELYSTPLPALP